MLSPEKDFEMSEILLCNRPLNPKDFHAQCGVSIEQVSAFSCVAPTSASANTPYLVEDHHSNSGRNILGQLAPTPVATELTNLSLPYGGDNVLALAEIIANLKEYNIGLMGASTSVYAHRIGGFAGSVKSYQAALMEYRHAVTSGSPSKTLLKQKARLAFDKMQNQFRSEVSAVTSKIKARRGAPLTNFDRAANIARSSRNVAKLEVTNQVQANHLVKLSSYAKFLGNGLAVIDFGDRAGTVHSSYKAGDNWERTLFIESSSFALSASSGMITVNAGTAALGFLMVATPIGWVGLVVGGLAVAGTAAAVSVGVNRAAKESSGSWYDSIMAAIGDR